MERLLLIPAAGTGSRLKMHMPKLLVPVRGRPMIAHILALYAGWVDRAAIVVSPSARAQVAEAVGGLAGGGVTLIVQDEPTGMLDAILLAEDHVKAANPRRVLITWCDQVAISPATVAAVAAASALEPEPPLVIPVCRSSRPYLHLERDAAGRIVRVLHRREGDAMPPAGESDAGVFDLSRQAYLEWLPRYAEAPDIGAVTRERNFVPFVAWCAARGPVATIPCTDPEEAIGINTPEDLALAEAYLGSREAS